jgi:hypothetical protein
VTDLSVPPVSDSLLADAQRLLLEPTGLEHRELSRVVASIHTHAVDFADLYFQYSRMESWSLEEGIVKAGSFNIDRGVGIRAVHGDKQAFAYSDDITPKALDEAAVAVRAIGRQGQSAVAAIGRVGPARSLYAPADPVASLAEDAKVALLERLERMARARDARVAQVMASLAGEYEAVLIARSDGQIAADVRPLVRVSITVIVEEGGRREQGYSGGGGRFDYSYFTDAVLESYAEQAVSQGAAQPRRARRAGRNDDRRARKRLARNPAARGDRPRARRRLQPQGNECILGPRGSARRRARHHGDRRRDDRPAARIPQRRRRRQSYTAHGADR